ncbi:MAG: thiamine-phosphate kinase [Alphaproteobacteria bacterium]|nr:thiamine-phosphate kinase [Alphaproteobacteria bacterium]
MPAPDQRPDEFAMIARLFAPLARDWPGAYGLLDDAATIAPPPGEELVVTNDLIVEGVHYLPDDPPDLVARKLLRVNVSDLAAKGARPLGYLLGLVLPPRLTLDWLERFAAGLGQDQARYGMSLIGGDTTAGEGPAVFSLTAFGSLPAGTIMRRGGAKPGDQIYLSGTLGDAALGLKALKAELPNLETAARTFLVDRYHLPEPRPELGQRLRGLAHAALDVSDGLIADLGHMADVSKVGAEIEIAKLPLSPAARSALAADDGLIDTVLTGGDDYEILFAAPESAAKVVRQAGQAAGVPISVIGRIVEGQGVRARSPDGTPRALGQGGFRHF